MTDLDFSHTFGLFHANLKHVEHLVIKHSGDGQVVRPLLGMRPEQDERSVVLLAPEFQR